jgi:hypothetical protein
VPIWTGMPPVKQLALKIPKFNIQYQNSENQNTGILKIKFVLIWNHRTLLEMEFTNVFSNSKTNF